MDRRSARAVIGEIEASYAELVGARRFEDAVRTLNELLDGLDSRQGASER